MPKPANNDTGQKSFQLVSCQLLTGWLSHPCFKITELVFWKKYLITSQKRERHMGLQEEIQETLERLDEAIHYERSSEDPERTIRLIHLGFVLNEAKKYVTSLQKEATSLLLDSEWDQTPYQSQQFSMETKTGNPRKKWDHMALANVVAKRIHDRSIDMDTGEVTKTAQQQIQELLEYASPSYWRVTALKDIGIDPDDYCEVQDPITNLIYRSNEETNG